MRFRAIVEYDGAGFHGWQVQPDRVTIQGTLEKAISTVLQEKVRVEASGRTDAGVHAIGQVIAFSVARVVPDCLRLQRSLNALCGPSVVVRTLTTAAPSFDPRRDAVQRSYEYRLDTRDWPSPFTSRWCWHLRSSVDVEAIGHAAKHLLGEHDFRSFQAADCDAKNPVRRVERSDFELVGSELVYRITANAFLRHMVRNIVGTLVEVGQGVRTADEIVTILGAQDRKVAGRTAPPQGLFLVRVNYPED